MSTFDWFMLTVGLLLAGGGILHRAKLLDLSRIADSAWLMPVLALGIPPTLLLLAIIVRALIGSDFALDILMRAVVLATCAAPIVGLFTLMILWVQGNVGRDGWRIYKVRYALVSACLNIVLPVPMVIVFIILALLRRAIVA